VCGEGGKWGKQSESHGKKSRIPDSHRQILPITINVEKSLEPPRQQKSCPDKKTRARVSENGKKNGTGAVAKSGPPVAKTLPREERSVSVRRKLLLGL